MRPVGNGYDIGAFEFTAITYQYHVETLEAEYATTPPPTATWTVDGTLGP
ncbi:MAG: hypothetical protein HZB19_15130 [Chloroflexi bacterium]|nr:hypothetical protein [Chloroflexota bacterium]